MAAQMLLLITTNYLSHLHLLLLLNLDRRRCRLVHLEGAIWVLHCQSPSMSPTAASRAVIDGLLRTVTRGLTVRQKPDTLLVAIRLPVAFRFLLIKAHGLDGDRSELINSLCVGHVGEQVTLNTVFLHIYGLVCLFLAMSLACRLLRSLRSADATLACLDCLLVAHSHLIKHGYDNATIDWPRSRIAVEVQACRQGLPQAYVLLVVGAEDVVCCLLVLWYSRRQRTV